MNKELKEDGFGDDIMSFLDDIDNVMDMKHLDDAKKMLSAEELTALENRASQNTKEGKAEGESDSREEGVHEPDAIGEGGGEDPG